MSVGAVVGLELFATAFADKHIATVLPNYVLVRRLQRLESLFTYITGVKPFHMSGNGQGVKRPYLGHIFSIFVTAVCLTVPPWKPGIEL